MFQLTLGELVTAVSALVGASAIVFLSRYGARLSAVELLAATTNREIQEFRRRIELIPLIAKDVEILLKGQELMAKSTVNQDAHREVANTLGRHEKELEKIETRLENLDAQGCARMKDCFLANGIKR